MIDSLGSKIQINRIGPLEIEKNFRRKLLEQESVIDKVKDEIDTQEEWLAQAGYTAYNVDIAFNSIKRVIAESEENNGNREIHN